MSGRYGSSTEGKTKCHQKLSTPHEWGLITGRKNLRQEVDSTLRTERVSRTKSSIASEESSCAGGRNQVAEKKDL